MPALYSARKGAQMVPKPERANGELAQREKMVSGSWDKPKERKEMERGKEI